MSDKMCLLLIMGTPFVIAGAMALMSSTQLRLFLSLFTRSNVIDGIRLVDPRDALWKCQTLGMWNHPSGILVYNSGVVSLLDSSTCARGPRAISYARRVEKAYEKRHRNELQQRMNERHLAALEAACGEVESPALSKVAEASLTDEEFQRLARNR